MSTGSSSDTGAPSKRGMMQRIFANFLKGLLVLVPMVGTIYVIFFIFTKIDGLLDLPVRGMGFLLTIVFIILIGALASNIFFRELFGYLESLVTRLPLVKLLYFSIKDLIGAFVGETKSFNRPVIVELMPENGIKAMGFITSENMDLPGTEGYVAVYLPQSYNFAANLILVPKARITPLPAVDSARFMAFIVSGGVSRGSGEAKPII